MLKKPVCFGPDADIIDIRRDPAFKTVFTRDNPKSRGALQGLLSCLTRRKISVLTITSGEPPANSPGGISCRFNDGEMAGIEMTLSPTPFEAVRLEFCVSSLFTAQEIQGNRKNNEKLKYTYQISVMGRKVFPDENLVHRFEYYDEKRSLSFEGKTRIITFELPKIGKTAERKTAAEMSAEERWAAFFWYSADKSRRELVNAILELDEAIAMAGETMLDFTKEEVEWFRRESEIKYEPDMRRMLSGAQDEAPQGKP
jgi:hypothetical protein